MGREIEITVSNIYSWIHDGEAIKIIKNEFGVKVDKVEHTYAYKSGWDGMFYPILSTGCFLTGMLPLFSEELKKHFVVYVNDHRENNYKPVNEIPDYLYDYQKDIVKKVINYSLGSMEFYRGIIDAATNAGKTYISLALWEIFDEPKTIFFVHRKKLFDQQLEFFKEKIGEEYVGQISEKIKDTDKLFIVAMYQSSMQEDLSDYKMIICDEAHRAKGTMYNKLLKRCKNAEIRYYISGTPLKVNEVDTYRIIGGSGKVLAKVTNDFLINEGYSVTPIIYMQKIINPISFLDYRGEYEELVINNNKRNDHIDSFVQANRRKRQTWVICRFVRHAELLADLLSAELLTGTTKKKESDRILNGFKKREIDCVVSTMVIDVGMNLPIEAFVLALGGKSEIDVLQLIGRALRTGNYDDVLILDFMDEGRYVGDHSSNRLNIYRKEKFKVVQLT